ncbi:MAG: thioredoxin fold domain-containing protein [Gammaproteobacteria bacterium]
MIRFAASVAFAGLLLTAPALQAETPQEKLAKKFPGVSAEDIRPAPVDGLWEVAVGTQVVYLTEDGRYLFRGAIQDLETGTNLTDARQATMRAELAGQLDESRMVVFSPDKPKHTITVFTDIDCGYCRKLHQEMPALNDLGIKVRYAFYPRAGPGSESWAKAEAVWCSPDRNDALTRAKAGENVTAPDCGSTPVADQYRLGNNLGVTGTPAILTSDGQLLPGYVPAQRLANYLDAHDN